MLRSNGTMMRRKLGWFVLAGMQLTAACGTEDETGEDTAALSDVDSGIETESTDPESTDTEESDAGSEVSDTEEPTDDSDAGGEDAGAGALSNEGGVDIEEPDGGGPTFSVTGRLKIGETLFVDSDTPNYDNPIIPNDIVDPSDPSQDQAQVISSPSTVGGYIGPLPVLEDGEPTGETRNDDVDFYRVTLAAGQT